MAGNDGGDQYHSHAPAHNPVRISLVYHEQLYWCAVIRTSSSNVDFSSAALDCLDHTAKHISDYVKQWCVGTNTLQLPYDRVLCMLLNTQGAQSDDE